MEQRTNELNIHVPSQELPRVLYDLHTALKPTGKST